MRILAIETSCDETAMAIVEAKGGLNPPAGGPQFKIVQNLVSSQIKIHRPFGGVVPNLAKREHLKNLPVLLKRIMKHEDKNFDLIAVTVGPGLEPALYTGVNFAKDLAKKWNKPIISVNHLEGHLYSSLLQQTAVNQKLVIKFPAVALIVSGGHTMLLLMKSLTHWKKLGETRDDAVGEAFDKVAKMLGLPYPGGPELEKLALNVPKKWQDSINFPRPMLNQKNYDFSFSGLKTAVLYHLFNLKSGKSFRSAALRLSEHGVPISIGTSEGAAPVKPLAGRLSGNEERFSADIAASFQEAAVEVLVQKTIRAVKEFKAKMVILTGGVAANKRLRQQLAKAIKKQIPNCIFQVPSFKFCTDNAVMIAAAAYINWLNGKKRSPRVNANLNL